MVPRARRSPGLASYPPSPPRSALTGASSGSRSWSSSARDGAAGSLFRKRVAVSAGGRSLYEIGRDSGGAAFFGTPPPVPLLGQREGDPAGVGLCVRRRGFFVPLFQGGGSPMTNRPFYEMPALAVYLGHVFESGRAPATAALAVAAVRFRAKLAGQPDPAGEATARVLGGYRRTAADRGRGQAAPLRADGLAAILATAERPRTDGRGVESTTTAQRRGRMDAVIAGLLFMGGLRRSEVAALRWADVTDATDGDGVLVTVRTSKTNQEGDAADVRYLKNGAAKAIRTLRAADAAPTDRVIGLSPLQIQRRFTAAARAAGHSCSLSRSERPGHPEGRSGAKEAHSALTWPIQAGRRKTSRTVSNRPAIAQHPDREAWPLA